MRARFISAACVILCSAQLFAANTVQNFQGDFPVVGEVPAIDVRTSNEGGGPQPLVVDGWDGNALRLTHDGVNGQNNSIAFNELVPADWTSLQIDLDIRVFGDGDNADGYGFAFLNAADYGDSTATATPGWQPEEPNLTNSFGVGFDTFHNDGLDPLEGVGAALPNSVSLHYDGAIVDQLLTSDIENIDGDFLPDNWIESGNPISLSIEMTPVADGVNATVTMIDQDTAEVTVPFENVMIPGMTAYSGRFAFRGRTGGADSDQEIDNIAYTINGGAQQVIEDFESYDVDTEIPQEIPEIPEASLIGGTPFVTLEAGSAPGPMLQDPTGGDGGIQDGYLQLTDAVNGQHNFVAFDKTSDVNDNFSASFKFRINDSGNNADGMAVMFADTDLYGDEGPITEDGAYWNPAEGPNLAGGFGIGFDTFDNDEEGVVDDAGCGDVGTCDDRRANHISLHWDGIELTDLFEAEGLLDIDEMDLVNDAWNEVFIDVKKTDGGSSISLSVVDGTDGSVHVVFEDYEIDDMEFVGGVRFAAGGRTGGANSVQAIDDLLIDFGEGNVVAGDFNNNGERDVADIDLLTAAITAGDNSFDLNGDNVVNAADRTFWVETLSNTYFGDSNFDGEFSSSDFVSVFGAAKYETGQAATWAEGDWNGDGVFSSTDFVAAFSGAGYEVGAREGGLQVVPEPSALGLLSIGALALLGLRRRK